MERDVNLRGCYRVTDGAYMKVEDAQIAHVHLTY